MDSRPVAAGLASADRYTSATVAPRRNSLPSDRVKPSSARWAIRSWTLPVSSGVVPTTTTRPDGAEVAQQRGEELVQRLQPGGLVDAGGVENQHRRTSPPSVRPGCSTPRRSRRPTPCAAARRRGRPRRSAGIRPAAVRRAGSGAASRAAGCPAAWRGSFPGAEWTICEYRSVATTPNLLQSKNSG